MYSETQLRNAYQTITNEAYNEQQITEQEYKTLTETAESGQGQSQGVRTEVRGQPEQERDAGASQELTDSEEREYSSTQVNIPEGPLQERILLYVDSIPEEDLYSDGSGQYGSETEPHVTALYGLTAENADQVRELLEGFGPVEITLGETSLFENEQYDVLKIDIDSPDLVRLNKLLRDNVEYENDYPDYRPHLTIAYIKPGEGAKYASNDTFAGETIILDELLFSGKDRTKTPISLISEDGKSIFNSVYSINKRGDIDYERLNEHIESIQEGVAYINALSLEEEQGRTKGGRANVEASLLVRGKTGSDPQEQREIRADQERILTEYAKSGQGAVKWFTSGEIDRMDLIETGTEARVYDDGEYVIKVGYNYLNFYDTPFDFLTNKISLHNYLFPELPLELLGFTETYGANGKGAFFAPVLRQRYVKGEYTIPDNISTEMQNRGFQALGENDFENKDYIIQDLHEENVLVGDDSNYLFINTVPELNIENRQYGNGELIERSSNETKNTNDGNTNLSPGQKFEQEAAEMRKARKQTPGKSTSGK